MYERRQRRDDVQITTPWIGLLLTLVAVPVAVNCSQQQSLSLVAKPVEVWRTGDDALTSRLRDAIENALGASSDFTLSHGRKPGTLLVTIPTHVKSKAAKGGQTRVFYNVEFSSIDTRIIGRSSGACWDDSLSSCAAQVVKDAKLAAQRIH